MPQYGTSNLANVLADIRKQRTNQLQNMLAKQNDVARLAPMGAMPNASTRPSLVGGLVKNALGQAGLSSLSKNFGNPSTTSPAPSMPQGRPTGNSSGSAPTGVGGGGGGGGGGFGGFMKDWGQGALQNLGLGGAAAPAAAAGAIPNAAAMTFSAPAAASAGAIPASLAAPAAAAAAPVGAAAGATGAAAGGGGLLSAIGGAASSAIAAIAALFSSERFKHDIHEVARIGGLRWVRYRYLPELDATQIERTGLLAEEVALTHPEWVDRGLDGRPLAVHYRRIPDHLWPAGRP